MVFGIRERTATIRLRQSTGWTKLALLCVLVIDTIACGIVAVVHPVLLATTCDDASTGAADPRARDVDVAGETTLSWKNLID
jgi:hypothetical protein